MLNPIAFSRPVINTIELSDSVKKWQISLQKKKKKIGWGGGINFCHLFYLIFYFLAPFLFAFWKVSYVNLGGGGGVVSTFFIRLLESIICKLASSEIWIL